jgi:hypothetical protein
VSHFPSLAIFHSSIPSSFLNLRFQYLGGEVGGVCEVRGYRKSFLLSRILFGYHISTAALWRYDATPLDLGVNDELSPPPILCTFLQAPGPALA